MKKIAQRILLLFAIFTGSLIAFTLMLNRYDAFSTQTMEDSSLPVLYMKCDGISVNRMCGYTSQIEEDTLRESLTPVSADRQLEVEIKPGSSSVNEASYQVSSLADGSVIENGRLTLESNDSGMSAVFTLNNPVAAKQEYMLRFAVDTGRGEPVYYYTRLVQDCGQNVSYYLDYADAFYQNCITGNLTNEMLAQLGTDSDFVNSSLHYVTLKSDKEQLAWGNLTPVLSKIAEPVILEVNAETVSIGMNYVVSAQNENDETEYYRADEYYRMRRNDGEIILLDYERSVTQIFDGEVSALTEDGISLGITGSDIKYVSNSSANIVAFVQAGELWLYDRGANKTCRIFSFATETHPSRESASEDYDISISSVSDEGNTMFAVYGYMRAGVHEGSTGVCFYRYYADTNTTQELLFIPSAESYQYMKQSLSNLLYVNSNNEAYMYFGNTLYKISLSDTPSAEVMESDIEDGRISVSDSQRFIALSEGDGEFANVIVETDLESGQTSSVTAPDGDYIKCFGFVGEDMVYGLANAENCSSDSLGNEVFPMYRVSVFNPDGQMARNYQIEGIYVTDVQVEDELINLNRAFYDENGALAATDDDQILYYYKNETTDVTLNLNVSERSGTLVQLDFSTGSEASNLLSMDARYVSEDSIKSLEIDKEEEDSGNYYLYAHGSLYGIYDRFNEAVADADENVGVVLDSSQSYVWERGNKKRSITLDAAQLPAGLLSATADEESVRAAVGDGYEVMSYTGCPLETVYYQISNGYAVVGKWDADKSVLILGYDIYDNTWLYNAETGETYAVAGEEAEAAFASQGNVFISYIET